MALKKCHKISYSLLDIILLCFCVTTIILLGLSFAWINKYNIFIHLKLYAPIGVLFFAQLFTLFISWIVLKGILTENLLIINTFCALFILKMILEMGMGVWLFMLRDDASDLIQTNMEYSYKNYTVNNYNKQEWNAIQSQLRCCGIIGPKSFAEYKVDYIPHSCCNVTVWNDSCENGFYQHGCHKVLTEYILSTFMFLGQSIFSYVALQIILLALFLNLRLLIKPDKKPADYKEISTDSNLYK